MELSCITLPITCGITLISSSHQVTVFMHEHFSYKVRGPTSSIILGIISPFYNANTQDPSQQQLGCGSDTPGPSLLFSTELSCENNVIG